MDTINEPINKDVIALFLGGLIIIGIVLIIILPLLL